MNQRQQSLFNEHREWAEGLAAQVWDKTPGLNGLEREDYRQHAMIGLIDAVKRYRPRSGKFEAFAYKRIRGAVREGVREADEVGRSRRAAGISGPTISLDRPVFDSDSSRLVCLRDLLVDRARHGRGIEDGYDEVAKVLAGVHREARAVVFLSAVVELNLRQIAAVLGCREQYASELLASSLGYLARSHTRAIPVKTSRGGTPALFPVEP